MPEDCDVQLLNCVLNCMCRTVLQTVYVEWKMSGHEPVGNWRKTFVWDIMFHDIYRGHYIFGFDIYFWYVII